MNFETPLQIFRQLDPQYLVAFVGLLIAFALFRLSVSIPRKIGQLRDEVRKAVENIDEADEARKREATLSAVRRFESDPEVRQAVRAIWEKTRSGHLTDYSLLQQEDKFQVLSFLNYLDGVACGLKQGILDETVAKDYLQHVIHKSVQGLLLGESGETWIAGPTLVDPDSFENLIGLEKRWKETEVHPLFRMMGRGVTS